MMLGVIRKLFARQVEAVPEGEPVFQSAGEPTSVGVGLEHDLRELAALAREFEPLFAYRPDLIPLVTEISQHDAESVRTLLQEASDGERSRLKQSLGGIQPHLTQLGNEELRERLEAMLTTLETTLPTRATLDHFHGLYTHELMRLPVTHPSQTEVISPLKMAASPDDLTLDLQLPSVYEQSLEAQEKTIAELKVLMMRHPSESSSEYQDFVAALTSLQIAQDSHLIAPELVMRSRDAYHRFESTRHYQSQSRRDAQRLRLEEHLGVLQTLPVLPSMQRQLESTKHVLEDYRDQLGRGFLEDHALESVEALLKNFRTHLDLSYRQELMNLVDRATLAKATGILIDLQQAGQMLDEGNYPDLAGLGDALHRYLGAEKHRLSSLRRDEKFQKKIDAARADFDRLTNLSHEEVEEVRQSLTYIEGQREHFQRASLVVQRELEKRLTKTITTIKRLTKYYEVTCAVAEELMTSNILDTLFNFDETAGEKVATSQPANEVITGAGNNSLSS
jgi:hypothetical protein